MKKAKIGRILVLIGTIFWFPFIIMTKTLGDAEEMQLIYAGHFLSITIMCLGGFLVYRAKQYEALEVADTYFNDAIPHVLYLRAFESDSNIEKYTSGFVHPKNLGMLVTEEEQLKRVFQPFGSLIAIGKPGESLPEPGAARMYVSENWKSAVTNKMNKARLVVIRAGGAGEGILWEIKYAFEILPAKKIILMVNMKSKDYRVFRESVHKQTKILLPDNTSLFQGMKGFIRFSENWTPEFLKMEIQIIRASGFKGQVLYSQFKFALKKVFEDYNVKWERPPISLVMLVAILFALLGVYGVIRAVLNDFF